jgi:hypothetical protein
MRRLILATAALPPPGPAGCGRPRRHRRDCGTYSTRVNGPKLTVTHVTTTGISCTAAERLVKQCTTMVGPRSSWKLSQKGRRITMVNGSRRIAFTLTRNSGDCLGS